MFELNIDNILNFKKLNLKLDDVNVICGLNKTGKSNILRLIYLMINFANSISNNTLLCEEMELFKYEVNNFTNLLKSLENLEELNSSIKDKVTESKFKEDLLKILNFLLNNRNYLIKFFPIKDLLTNYDDIKKYLNSLSKEIEKIKSNLSKVSIKNAYGININNFISENNIGINVVILKNKIIQLVNFWIRLESIIKEIDNILNSNFNDNKYINFIFNQRFLREYDLKPPFFDLSTAIVSNYISPILNVNDPKNNKGNIIFSSEYNINYSIEIERNPKNNNEIFKVNTNNLLQNNYKDKFESLNVYFIKDLGKNISLSKINSKKTYENNILKNIGEFNKTKNIDIINSELSLSNFLLQNNNLKYNDLNYYDKPEMKIIEKNNKNWFKDTNFDYGDFWKIQKNKSIIPFQSFSDGEKSKAVINLLLRMNFFNSNSIIIFDEFEKNLDPKTQFQFIKILMEIKKITGCKLIFSTHSVYTLTSIEKYIKSNSFENKITWNYFKLDNNNNVQVNSKKSGLEILEKFEDFFVY